MFVYSLAWFAFRFFILSPLVLCIFGVVVFIYILRRFNVCYFRDGKKGRGYEDLNHVYGWFSFKPLMIRIRIMII